MIQEQQNQQNNKLVCKYCQSKNIIKFGTYKGNQRYFCNDCKRKFTPLDTLPKMKTPINQIASAIGMYFDGLSLNDVRRQIKWIYKNDISDFAVYNWVDRFTKDSFKITQSYQPKVGYVWAADETVVDIGGQKYWLFDVIDIKTRFLLASRLAEKRMVEDVQKVMKEAYKRCGIVPKVIMTDSLNAYEQGIKNVFGNKAKQLKVGKFVARPNNNIIERMHGTIKERTKIMRGLKDKKSAEIILDGFFINYNFFRPHGTLSANGKDITPAQKAGIKFPFESWELLIKNSQEAKRTAVNFEVKPLPIIKLDQQNRKRMLNRKVQRRLRAKKYKLLKRKQSNEPQLATVRFK
jgi:putative transposase